MPRQVVLVNAGAPVAAHSLLERETEESFFLGSANGRPVGVAESEIVGSGVVTLFGNVQLLLAPNVSIAANDVLVTASMGHVTKKPNGWTGPTVGTATETKSASGVPQVLSAKLRIVIPPNWEET